MDGAISLISLLLSNETDIIERHVLTIALKNTKSDASVRYASVVILIGQLAAA